MILKVTSTLVIGYRLDVKYLLAGKPVLAEPQYSIIIILIVQHFS